MPHAIALSALCNNHCPQNCCFHHFCCFHWVFGSFYALCQNTLQFFVMFLKIVVFVHVFIGVLGPYHTSCRCPLLFFCNNLLSKLLFSSLLLRSLDPFVPFTIALSNFLKFSSKLLFSSLSGGLWTHSCLFPLHSAIFCNCCFCHFLHFHWGLWTLSCKCYLLDNLHTARRST